jgi:transposase-like protein
MLLLYGIGYRNLIQVMFFPNKKKKNRIVAFIIDKTIVQIGDIDAWLWVAIEPIHNRILGVSISRHSNMLS